MNALDAYKKSREQSDGNAYTVLMTDRIKAGKDTLFNDIMSFGKNAMGDNPFSGYYKQGYKTPDDYNAASNYLLSSIDSLKGFKDRLNKNRTAYERVYGADTVKKQEESLDQMLSLYNSQDLWNDIEGRRDAYGKYKDKDEYDTLNDMTAGRENILNDKIAEAQRVYDEASKNRSYTLSDWVKKRNGGQVSEDEETKAAKSELERLKQLKLDWEGTRANYDDEGNPFSEKYNGYDYKGIGLAINKLASNEYALSDSQQRELKWLRDNQISYANDEELENALALAEGQAQNAEAERYSGTRFPTLDNYNKYTARAATLKSYSAKRKADEKLKETEQAVHDEYMPLLDDPEFVKHTERESSKIHRNGFGGGMGPNYKNEDQVYSYLEMFTTPNETNQAITDEEAKIFVGLYNTQGKIAAKKYLDALEPIYNARSNEAAVNAAIKDTRENPIVNEMMSLVTSLMQGLAAPIQYTKSALGEEIDTNSPLYSLANYTSAVRGTTSQMLSDYLRKNPDSFWNTKSALFGRDEDGNYRALGLFAKETTESMLDNIARIAVSKGIGTGLSEAALKTVDFTLMGSQVATQTIIDAKKKGLSDGKALAMGFTSGAIEAITEVWSIERVLKNPKNFVTTLGKSLVAEGSEEIASNVLNRAVDVLVNADQSEVMQEYYGYINEGLSPSEASAKTVSGILGDDISAGLGGALSGVMMSGVNYGVAKSYATADNIKNGVRQIKVGRELKSTDSVITSLDEIIAANPDNKEAITAKEAIEKGEKVSARRLGKLLSDEFSEQYVKAVSPVDSTEVKAKLEQNGVKNAETLSKTIAKAFNEGQDSVKGKERTELTNNSEAMKVYREYLTERENAAENTGRLTRVYTNVDRAELLSYAKEQGKNNSFIREASDLAEGKTDLDSLDNLQEAVFTEITDQFLSADTVKEAQTVYIELAKGAGKGIKSLLDTALDNRTEEITAANSYDTVESFSFKNTKEGVKAVVSTAKGENLSPLSANIGYEAAAVINNAADRPSAVRSLYANEYLESNRHLVASTYNRLFDKYFKAGEEGKSFSDIKRSSRDIKADSARRIYEAGRRATENESKRQEQYKRTDEYKNRSKERTEQNTAAEKLGGVVREYSADKKISRSQRRQLKLFDVWAKKKGVVIRVVSSLAEKYKLESKIINGEYAGGNTIVIALDGKNALTSTAGHEMYHMIENLSPEYAQSFREFVIDHLKAAGQYENVFKDYERRYGKAYARDESFKAKIDEEIVADHCFEAMTNKEQWDSFAAENKTLAEKIKDFILEFVAMINRAYDKYFAHDNAEIRNEVLGEIDYMNEIAKRLWEGVDEAVENYRFGAGTESETRFKLVDKTGDGIEVYETSQDVLNMTAKERKKAYLDLMRNEYAGRTARFVRNGHTYYAEFDRKNYSKPIYGEKHNSKRGLAALIRSGADGDVFDLVENSRYADSSADTKNHKAKDGFTDYFDYFVKTVQIDGRVYDLTATVKKQYGEKNGFTYSLFLKDNKKIKAAPTKDIKYIPQRSAQPSSDTTVTQGKSNVNTHSMQNSKNNSSFSISDADYLAAAESGDEKTAAEMVKKAAEEAFKDSVIRDDDGNLLKVYHGRVSEFNIFDREFASIEGDMGKGFYFSSQEDDVDSNYANVEAPDLTNKIARLAERIEAEQDIDYDEAEKKAREQYIKSEPNTVEAYLNVKNPAIISNDSDGTYLEYNENYDEEADEYGDPEGSLVDFVEALELAAKDYESFRPVNFWEALGESIYDGGISLKDAISLLKENIFDELSDENGDFAINEVIRQAIEDIGFDGIIDKTVSEKFTNMQGMYSDTTHYIVFDSSQIKSADPITYDDSGNIIPLSGRFNSSEKDIRYSISKKFYDDFDKWDGKNSSITFEIGNTSDALQSIGIKNQKIIMHSGMILNKLNKHSELSRDIFRQIPELLERPVIVQFSDAIDSKTGKQKYDSRITVLGELYTEKESNGRKANNPVLVSIELLPQNKKSTKLLNVSVITSAYAKSNLQRYINKNSILYIDPDKKRTNKWLSLNRLQLPVGENRLGSIRRITYIGGKVKIENSKNFSPMQAALEKAGVVNSSGISLLNNSENDTGFSEKILSDDQRASVSDAGMRLTDDAELSSLLREQAYKAEIERLKGEFVKSKRMGGKGKNRLVQADINRIARDIISEYSSKIDFSTLRDELTGLYELMDNIEIQGSADYAELVKLSNDIAKSVIASSYVDITDQSAEKYKAAMRSYRLTPSLQDVAELEDMFGTFGAAYRQYGRKLNMRAQGTPGALHIDEVWEELCDSVPFLDRDAVSTQDMWRNLIEVRDSLDEKNGFNPYITDGDLTANEAAGALGADILERFNEVRADTTFADRAQQRVDLRERKISELKAENRRKLAEARTQRKQRIESLKQSFREQNRKNRERRNGTDTKNKIRRVVKKLRSLYLHPTKERNIKKELRPMIEKTLTASEFLFAKQKSDYEILMGVSLSDVGNNTKAAESLVKLNETYLAFSETNAEISRIKAQIEASDGQNLSELEDRTEQLTKQRDKQQALLKRIAAENGLSELAASRREQLNRTTVKNALSELYDAYRQLKKSKSQYIQGVYSETVENRIEVIKDTLGGKTVSEMSNSELEQLYDVYKMLYSSVTGANKIFASGKKATVEEMSLAVMEEIENVGKNDSLISGKQAGDRNLATQKAIDAKRGIEWEMLQPLTAFYKTGSKTFRELYNQALEGQDKWARLVAEFKAFATGKRRQHGVWSIDESMVTEYTLESGERIKLTVPELMSVYALSRRDQGRKHLLVGGITLAENEIKTGEKVLGVVDKRYGRDTARAYHLTEGDLSFLAERLDGNLRKYVEEMQEYLSTVVAEKGNEVARVLYGIDIFGEANYFPISSDRRFLFSSNKAVDSVSLKNIGMTKNTVPNAANPVVIASFDKVWNDHTAKMALYSSMVLPIENMNRVLNFTSYLSEAESSAYSRSVRTVLEENFGKSASKYFEQFVVDLNGGITGVKGGFWERAVSKMKKTAVAASLSVIVQQPTAIIRAFALINPKYFAGFKTQKEIAGSTRYEEIKRWAPIAIVKEIGGFDTGSGRAASEYIGAKEYSGVKNKVKGFFTDSYYRDEKFMVGAAKADELGWGLIWDAVKREIADTTDLKFNSKEFLEACGKRFTDVIVQTQVYDSTLSRSSIMRNKSDIAKMATSFMGEPMTSLNMLYRAALDVNRSKGKAIGTSARAVAAVIGSMVAGAIVKALISAGRDDDDDESYADKYFQAVGGGLVDELNPLNLIPFARDLVTIFQGYDIDRADMTLFKDLWDAITKLDSDKISDYRKVENVVGAICNIFGLPVRNIMRDVRTAYNSAVSAFRPSSQSVSEALTEGIIGKEITDLDRYETLYDKEDLQGTKNLIKQMIEKEREKLLAKGEDQYEINSKGQNKVNVTARANVRNKFSNRYREQYKEAYKNRDTVTVAKIKTRLSLTGLYDDLDKTLEEWRNSADEEVKKEKRAKEYNEKNK